MTTPTLPPPVDGLDFGGRRMLALVLLETLAETPDDARLLRDRLARLRQHRALSDDVRAVVDAAFHLAVWVTLNPDQRQPVRAAAASSGTTSDHADVLAAVSEAGQPALAGVAAAVAALDPARARATSQQLKATAVRLKAGGRLGSRERLPALLDSLGVLVAWTILNPIKGA